MTTLRQILTNIILLTVSKYTYISMKITPQWRRCYVEMVWGFFYKYWKKHFSHRLNPDKTLKILLEHWIVRGFHIVRKLIALRSFWKISNTSLWSTFWRALYNEFFRTAQRRDETRRDDTTIACCAACIFTYWRLWRHKLDTKISIAEFLWRIDANLCSRSWYWQTSRDDDEDDNAAAFNAVHD